MHITIALLLHLLTNRLSILLAAHHSHSVAQIRRHHVHVVALRPALALSGCLIEASACALILGMESCIQLLRCHRGHLLLRQVWMHGLDLAPDVADGRSRAARQLLPRRLGTTWGCHRSLPVDSRTQLASLLLKVLKGWASLWNCETHLLTVAGIGVLTLLLQKPLLL